MPATYSQSRFSFDVNHVFSRNSPDGNLYIFASIEFHKPCELFWVIFIFIIEGDGLTLCDCTHKVMTALVLLLLPSKCSGVCSALSHVCLGDLHISAIRCFGN